MATVYINGDWLPPEAAQVSAFDRGFLFADGVYEVIPVYNSQPFRLAEHLQRLENSLAALGIANPHTESAWDTLIRQLIAHNQPAPHSDGNNLSIYLQLTRGSSGARDHSLPRGTPPTVFACTSPLKATPAEVLSSGVSAITLDDIRWQRCDIKSTSLLANILLKQQADAAGVNEAILLRDGQLTEGSTSNVFIVSKGHIYTPPKSTAILPGVTRDLIIELAEAKKLPLREQSISVATLRAADELWISSSTRELYPVCTLDSAPIGEGVPGPLWQTLHNEIQHFKANWHG